MIDSIIKSLQIISLQYRNLWLLMGWSLVGLVLYLSLTAQPIPLDIIRGGDKYGHFVAYFTMMLWFANIYRGKALAGFAISLVTMGLVLEVIQGTLSYRGFDWFDMAANSLGVAVAILLAFTPMSQVLMTIERVVRQN